MVKKYLQLNDISAYKISFNLSNYIWKIVIKWDIFSKKTVGEQFVRAADSISANIAEGFARKGKKDKVKFYFYSHGSVKESLDWNEKARVRAIITEDEYTFIYGELSKLPKELNSLIRFTREKLKE